MFFVYHPTTKKDASFGIGERIACWSRTARNLEGQGGDESSYQNMLRSYDLNIKKKQIFLLFNCGLMVGWKLGTSKVKVMGDTCNSSSDLEECFFFLKWRKNAVILVSTL